MLGLIRGLADCDEKFFGGWILARAQIDIDGRADTYVNKIVQQRRHRAVMQVQGAKDGIVCQSMQVLLLLPDKDLMQHRADEHTAVQNSDILLTHRFTQQEIDAYVRQSGDENIIHKRRDNERVIVPGLCMAYFLQRQLKLTLLHWRISFLAPVFADDEVAFILADEIIKAYVQNKLVLKIEV